MKKLNYPLLLLTAFALLIISCGKDGSVGPQGATGPAGANGTTGATGPIGPAGPPGANGKDGSVIYAGATDPAAALGAVGDFYLNKSNGLLYGPKTATGWGTGFSLKGATGATGATGANGAAGAAGTDGNTILSGTGIPAAGLGNAGDFYLDKSNYKLYGPKDASGWGPATSLKGPTGATGATGATGTANVLYSGWNYATNFRDTTADNSALHAADISAPALSQSILDGGVVQVYFTFGGGVYTLPYTSYAGGKLNTISYWPRLKHIIVTRFTADNSNSVPLSTILQYRYVIIPGGTALAAIKNNHVNLNDYEAVRKFFRIQDQ